MTLMPKKVVKVEIRKTTSMFKDCNTATMMSECSKNRTRTGIK